MVLPHLLALNLYAQTANTAPTQASRLRTDPRPRALPAVTNHTVVVRPPQMQFDSNGQINIVPNVELYDGNAAGVAFEQAVDSRQGAMLHGSPVGYTSSRNGWQEGLPPPNQPAEMVSPTTPIFDQVLTESCQQCQQFPHQTTRPRTYHDIIAWLLHLRCDSGSFDKGVGVERVMNAPFEIYTSQPENNYRFRLDFGYDVHYPDRSEFFWAATRGPGLPEERVNFQDIRMMIETGGPAFSLQTEVPIRVIDPLNNANHAGLGDMSITTKTRMLNGDRWQLTQIFKTHINTGSATMGLGTGHVSLEPGFAYRYRWNDWFYLHGDTTYWFALGGDPTFSGQVFRTSFGMSGVLYENDVTALIPTLEFISWTALNGLRTSPVGVPEGVDGDSIFNIHPGLRYAWDTGGDFGLLELGLSGGVSVTGHHWYQGLLRFDVRWAY